MRATNYSGSGMNSCGAYGRQKIYSSVRILAISVDVFVYCEQELPADVWREVGSERRPRSVRAMSL